MSYAAVAAHNAPSPSEQPHPDPALLTTEADVASPIVDDTSKVNVVPHDFKSNPVTVTSAADVQPERDPIPQQSPSNPQPSKSAPSKKREHKAVAEAKAESIYLLDMAHNILFRPGVAGGLLGIVNVGLAVAAGYSFYNSPHLRRDRTTISSVIASAFALIGAEGYAVEKYRQTARGQEEERQAKEKGTVIYRHLREQIFRPGVLGGLVGAVNTAILGVVGYYSYSNWNRPTWDRRVVSAVSVGLLMLWGGEGALAERFRERR